MTNDEMERDLTDCRALLPARLTADRSRHETVVQTSLWIFDRDPGNNGARRQIGSISRIYPEYGREAWHCARMAHGGPISDRTYDSLAQAVEHIVSYNREPQSDRPRNAY